jgi:hypothetical protein
VEELINGEASLTHSLTHGYVQIVLTFFSLETTSVFVGSSIEKMRKCLSSDLIEFSYSFLPDRQYFVRLYLRI